MGIISLINDCILTIVVHAISTNEMLDLTLGQSHKVKGQGQVCKFGKKHLFRLYIMNQWLDIDDNYTHD